MTPPLWQKAKSKEPFVKVKEKSEKAGLKLNIQKTKIMGSGPISLVQFSRSVMSNSATPRTAAYHVSLSITNSQSLLKLMSIESVMPSIISTFVVPSSYCLQYFPASGSFPVSQFSSDSQSIGVSALASVLPMNIQE